MASKKSQPIKLSSDNKQEWTFLSNHAHILICLYRDSTIRLRDLALNVGITERAVIKIIEDLETAGVLTRSKDGRRNNYKIFDTISLRHPLESHKTIGVKGYTVSEARGEGLSIRRDDNWEGRNIRIEILANEEMQKKIFELLQEKYFNKYKMIAFSYPVNVLRREKFE